MNFSSAHVRVTAPSDPPQSHLTGFGVPDKSAARGFSTAIKDETREHPVRHRTEAETKDASRGSQGSWGKLIRPLSRLVTHTNEARLSRKVGFDEVTAVPSAVQQKGLYGSLG